MKLILSRKGFDSRFGGVASPIFPDGTMLSLPIPDEERLTATKYRELRAQNDVDVGLVVEQLTRGHLTGDHRMHFDPDLERSALARHGAWAPGFGPGTSAWGHLKGQGVGDGDLFLFFGWFRDVEQVDGTWRYKPKGVGDIHAIFGWMYVEGAPVGNTTGTSLGYHPHSKSDGSADPVILTGSNAGMFTNYSDALRLTAPGCTRSIWSLPSDFFPRGRKPMSYHPSAEAWREDGGRTILKSARIGQEFVLDLDQYPELVAWTEEIIGENR